jgi:threonine dehydrogenase-like Zn-dependent dehydrogenase
MLLRLEGLDVHFYDRAEGGVRREIADMIGANYVWANEHSLRDLANRIGNVDIVFEATGYSPLAFEAMEIVGNNGIVCLSGVSGGERQHTISADRLSMEIVLSNKVIFGTVSAGPEHFEGAARHLATISALVPGVLPKMITSQLPFDQNLVSTLLTAQSDEIKRVVQVS